MKSITKISIILTLFLGIIACGKQGALYLEEEKPVKKPIEETQKEE